MRQFDVADAQQRFEELVDVAADGEIIGITRDQQVVVLLVPLDFQPREPDA